MIPEPDGRPTWRRPAPYGHPESIQAAGMVVAPLLAGFTIALMGLVVDASNNGIRHRDTALLVLMGAVTALLAAIQCAYSARRYMVLPDELTAWWPGLTDAGDANQVRQARELQAEQLAHRLLHGQWADRFRVTYHVGIVLLLTGLTVVLIPPAAGTAPAGTAVAVVGEPISDIRWAAILLGGAAAAGELVWIAATMLNSRSGRGCLGRAVVAAARRLVPSYDVRLRDARAALAARRLMHTIAAAGLDPSVRGKFTRQLAAAAASFERGNRRQGLVEMQTVGNLLRHEAGLAAPGLSDDQVRAWSTSVDEVL